MSTQKNYCTNPSPASNTGYTAVPGTSGAITAGVVNTAVVTAFGAKVNRVTWTTASTAAGGGLYYELTLAGSGLAVGNVISAAVFHVLSHIINRLQLQLSFYNGASLIGSATLGTAKVVAVDTVYGTALAADPAFEIDAVTIPATTTKIRVAVLSVAGTSYANWSIGSYLQIAGVMITNAATVGSYIDGGQGNAYGWDGTANASSSTQYTPTGALDYFLEMDPKPRAQITLTNLYPGTQSLTLYRSADGVVNTVREAVKVSAIGAFTVLDLEAPYGVPVTWYAQQFDVGGNPLGYTPDTVGQLNPILGDGAADWAVLSDPLQPSSAVLVQLTENAAYRPSRTVPGTMINLGDRTVTLVGPRGLLTDLPMDFWTTTAEDAAAIDDLFTQARGLVLFQTLAPVPVPRLLYAFAANPIPDDIDLNTTMLVEWLVTVQENSPSTLGYGEALFPWSIYKAAFATWATMKAAYAAWLEAKRNPPAGIG